MLEFVCNIKKKVYYELSYVMLGEADGFFL